jgi:hypothetical protein
MTWQEPKKEDDDDDDEDEKSKFLFVCLFQNWIGLERREKKLSLLSVRLTGLSLMFVFLIDLKKCVCVRDRLAPKVIFFREKSSQAIQKSKS